MLQGRKKARNEEFHLVLFNDKLALFRVKVKAKKVGYKVISIWTFNQISCSPLGSQPVLSPPSPTPQTSSVSGASRIRGFSRGNTDNNLISTSPGRHPNMASSSPINSPRNRSGRSQESDALPEEGKIKKKKPVILIRILSYSQSLMNIIDIYLIVWECVECGMRLSEKDKEVPDHRLLFSSPPERDDWIAKLREYKVDYVLKYGTR
jgi:hypothetical protein